MATTNYSWNLPVVGGSESTWGTQLNDNWTALDTLLGGTSATEFSILDGATVTTDELNYVSGVTSPIQTQIDAKPAATVTISAGDGLTGGGDLSANRTISHADTSSQASVDNSGTTFIQDITLDTYGHVTGIGSATIPQGIGDGQTWQVPSRGNGVAYQNTTGKPIMAASFGNRLHPICISATGSGYVCPGLGWNNNGENPFFVIIPNGHYYYYTTIYSGLAELR